MHVDPSRWFDALGSCATCRKPSHGHVRGPRNESMGQYCTKCAEARLKKAAKEQARAAKAAQAAYHADSDGDIEGYDGA